MDDREWTHGEGYRKGYGLACAIWVGLRVKSNDNVTETGSFSQMIMLPGMSPPFQGFCWSSHRRVWKAIDVCL